MSTIKSIIVSFALVTLFATSAFSYSNPVSYTGQGIIANDFGGFDFGTELCGTSNGAEVNGPYILWVMTATRANNADITGPWGTAQMTKFGNGVFKYVSSYYSLGTLSGNVTGTYDGAARNVQLVISHGCRPFTTQGAWCSPGFWRNASDAAWALTGYTKLDTFNDTVVPNFYDTAAGADPTLIQVLTTPGANTFGASRPPFGLNAYNATGAFLTNNIPGFQFSLEVMNAGGEEACPIDNHGNLK